MLKQLLSTVLLSGTMLIGLSATAQAQLIDITERGGYITTSFIPTDNAAERAGRLIDNNSGTKLYAGNGAGGTITYKINQPEVVTAYSITSANDAADRDMAGWLFQGSIDGTTNSWVTLDTRTKETFPDRFQKRVFTITNSASFQYYRWTQIFRNGSPAGTGGTTGSIQLAEVELLAATSTGLFNIMLGGVTYDAWATAAGAEGPEKATDSYIYTPSASNAAAAIGGGSRYSTANPNTWLVYVGNVKTMAKSYGLTSGNDVSSDANDPKDWTLYASNDSTIWVTLDAQTGQAFSARSQTKTYTFTNTTFYKYYKLDVTANNGGTKLVIAEWQVDGQAGLIPATPTNVAISTSTNNSITLTWNDLATNEDSYIIEQSKDKSNWYRSISAPANATSFTVTELAQNVRYYFRLSAKNNDFGKSPYSEIVTKKTVRDGGVTYANITEYAGILDETYNKGGGEGRYALLDQNVNTKYSQGNPPPIWLRWTAMFPAAVDKYTITSANDTYWGDPQTWTFEATDDTNATWKVLDTRIGEVFDTRFQKVTYTFTNTTRYKYYRLNVSSATLSSIQMSDMEIFGTSNGEGGLTKPTNLTADLVESAVDQIELNWADNTTEEDNYVIEQSLDSKAWTTSATVDKNTTVYIVSGLEPSTKYFFRVSAVNTDDRGTSDVVEITTSNPSMLAPTEGYGDGYSKTSTVITWVDNSLGEDGYEVDRCLTSDFTPLASVKTFTLEANATNYIDTNLAVNTTYYYRVRATSTIYNNSDYTPAITATTYKDLSGLVYCDTLPGVSAQALYAGNGGEEEENILDGNPDTKYNMAAAADPPMWVEIDFAKHAVAVTSYVVVSAFDNAGNVRDPYEWILEGSNDGTNWDQVHDLSSTPQKFAVRKQEKQYNINNTVKYSRYRLNVTGVVTPGSYYVQLADLKLYAEKKDVVVTSVKETKNQVAPKVFTLSQNYPNPFNPTTNFNFTLEKSGQTVVKVYNILGAEVATLFNGNAEAGKYYHVTFDASHLASGVYITRIESGSQNLTRKIVLMK